MIWLTLCDHLVYDTQVVVCLSTLGIVLDGCFIHENGLFILLQGTCMGAIKEGRQD